VPGCLEAEDSSIVVPAQETPRDGRADAIDVRSALLAGRAKAGDERAIEELWKLNEPDLHLHLSRYLRDPRDVAEASQEVFIRMLTALPEYKVSEIPFRFWLQRIGRNHAIDVLRREKHSQVEQEDRLNRLLEDAGGAPGMPGGGWLDDERTALAVSALPVAQQRMLLLRFGFGLKSEEVAKLLHMSPAAVRKQQSRALRRLAAALDAAGD
jgi:RNA polymerase sigma-70 factor, ECF subfamily